MALSGSIDFSLNRNELIKLAYQKTGAINEGEEPTSDQYSLGASTLNMLIKTWQANGLQLFAIDRYALFVNKGQERYSLVSSTTDNFVREKELIETAVSAEVSPTIITVDDATGISDGDYIGVQLGTDMFWTTVSGAPAGNNVTLAEALTGTAEENAKVFAYTTKANRPMQVSEAYLVQTVPGNDIPIGVVARRRYDTLSNKSSTGYINQVYYDPQVTTGDLYVWPTGSSEANYIRLIVQRTMDDVDAADDDIGFPQEWYLPLVYNLAALLCDDLGVPDEMERRIRGKAMFYYDMCNDWDDELFTSLYFQPDFRGEEV